MTSIAFSLIAGSTILLLAGCTTIDHSPERGSTGFDSTRTVSITPHENASDRMIPTGIGAQWTAAKKDEVILIIAVFNNHVEITGAELNIGGERIALTPTANVTDMKADLNNLKTSTKGFLTTLHTVKKIVNSGRTWLRVHTPTGTMDDAVKDRARDSKAYHALKRFMNDVKP